MVHLWCRFLLCGIHCRLWCNFLLWITLELLMYLANQFFTFICMFVSVWFIKYELLGKLIHAVITHKFLSHIIVLNIKLQLQIKLSKLFENQIESQFLVRYTRIYSHFLPGIMEEICRWHLLHVKKGSEKHLLDHLNSVRLSIKFTFSLIILIM